MILYVPNLALISNFEATIGFSCFFLLVISTISVKEQDGGFSLV